MRRTHQNFSWVTLAGSDRLEALAWLIEQLRWEERLAELEEPTA
jgi:hypothetical protein